MDIVLFELEKHFNKFITIILSLTFACVIMTNMINVYSAAITHPGTPLSYHEEQTVGTTIGFYTLTSTSSVTGVTKKQPDDLLSRVFGNDKEYLTVSAVDNSNRNLSTVTINDWSHVYIVDDQSDVRLEVWHSKIDGNNKELLFVTQDMLDAA